MEEKRKVTINNLLTLFNNCKVYYNKINDYEIELPVPADIVSEKIFNKMISQKEIIKDKETGCYTDEAKICIEVTKNGKLNWLIVLPNYSDEEE